MSLGPRRLRYEKAVPPVGFLTHHSHNGHHFWNFTGGKFILRLNIMYLIRIGLQVLHSLAQLRTRACNPFDHGTRWRGCYTCQTSAHGISSSYVSEKGFSSVGAVSTSHETPGKTAKRGEREEGSNNQGLEKAAHARENSAGH